MGLDEAEGQILEMVNWIGDTMVQEVVAGLAEPTSANQITIGGEVAVFERVRNLRFINRFGEEVVRPRRCYRYRDRAGGVAPLDAKLGIDGCFGFYRSKDDRQTFADESAPPDRHVGSKSRITFSAACSSVGIPRPVARVMSL